MSPAGKPEPPGPVVLRLPGTPVPAPSGAPKKGVLPGAADAAPYEVPSGSIGRSGRPRSQAERAKFEVPGQRWADVSEGGYGVTILNDCKDGWDYKAGPGGGVLRLSLLKAPIYPDSTADRGRHHFRLAVYPHAGDWRAAEGGRRAGEYKGAPLAGAHLGGRPQERRQRARGPREPS